MGVRNRFNKPIRRVLGEQVTPIGARSRSCPWTRLVDALQHFSVAAGIDSFDSFNP